MVRDNQELPERAEETAEDSDASHQSSKNVKQEKLKKKNVKIEHVKKENECIRKLSEISPPKIRKILHKIMAKYYNDPFYETNDIAKKILKKLKVNNTSYFMTRIKKNMDKWISDNVIDSDSEEDSSDDSNNKESKDIQKEEKKIPIKTTGKIKEKPSIANIVLEADPAEVDVPPGHNQVDKKKIVNNAKMVKVEEGIPPMIDLTVEVKKEVKKEIITIIDEEIPDNSNKVINSINTPVNGAPFQHIQSIPIPALVPGYNPTMPTYYPSEFYQPFYPTYDPNICNPYLMPYVYQYPYTAYCYHPSDLLPNYPVDETGNNNSKVMNNGNGSHPTDSKDVDAGDS